MTEYLLVIAFYAGSMLNAASGVSVSTVPVPFVSEGECDAAGSKIKSAFEDKAKWAGFLCLKHTSLPKGEVIQH